MSKSNCPACGEIGVIKFTQNIDESLINLSSFSSRKNPELMHHELLECISCKTLFTDNPYSYESLIAKYRQASYDSNLEANYAAETYAKLSFENIKKKINNILDIGTGNGSYLIEISKFWDAKNLIGLEPSFNAAKELRSNKVKILNKSLEEFKTEIQFDLIACFQTIEHVIDPNKWLKRFSDLLSDEGLVVLTCHNNRSLVNKILGKKSPIFDIEHLQVFTKSGIKSLFERNNFEILEIYSYKNNYPLSYWVRISPIPNFIKNFILKSFWGNIMVGINVGNIFVLARKLKPII